MNYKRAIRLEFEGADIDPITDLRIAFDVSKADGGAFNKGKIFIYNLRPSSRYGLLIARIKDEVDDEPVIKVRLFAGYEGNLKLLMSGDILISKNTKSGTDWITEIEIWAGLTAATKATVVEHWDGKTPALNIIKALLQPLSPLMHVSYTEAALDALEGQSYVDFSESGMSMVVARRFLKRFDLDVLIETDGKMIVYKQDEPIDPDKSEDSTNRFSLDNGLIGSPVITRVGVDFLALLRPEINLLQKVFVQSKTINETLQRDENLTNEYFVKGVRHFGDTHEDEWFTEISAHYPLI